MTKRTFLKTLGAAASPLPGLALMQASAPDSGKFTTVDCSVHFTASPALFASGDPAGDTLSRFPAGRRVFRGIPFELAREGSGKNAFIVVSRKNAPGATARVEIPLRESITVSAPGWIAARCASRFTFGRARVAAHTSPVYLVVPGRELFDAPMASYLMTLIDGSEAWLKKLAVRADAARHERALAVLAQARELLHARMHRHGHA